MIRQAKKYKEKRLLTKVITGTTCSMLDGKVQIWLNEMHRVWDEIEYIDSAVGVVSTATASFRYKNMTLYGYKY